MCAWVEFEPLGVPLGRCSERALSLSNGAPNDLCRSLPTPKGSAPSDRAKIAAKTQIFLDGWAIYLVHIEVSEVCGFAHFCR